MTRFIVVRHGFSEANNAHTFAGITDPPLTEKGKRQAEYVAAYLAKHEKVDHIFYSGLTRTRQTAEEFNHSLGIKDIREDITITEQQYGLFDSVPEDQWGVLYPREYAEFVRQVTNSGKFYARLPLGESPFDVAIRVHQFMGTIHRDLEKHGVDTLFVFSHGTTIRTFLMRWFHYSTEWYQNERNPKNLAVREIDGDLDLGYLDLK